MRIRVFFRALETFFFFFGRTAGFAAAFLAGAGLGPDDAAAFALGADGIVDGAGVFGFAGAGETGLVTVCFFGAPATGATGFFTPVDAAVFCAVGAVTAFLTAAVPATAAPAAVAGAGWTFSSLDLKNPRERFFRGATWAPPFFFPAGFGGYVVAGSVFAEAATAAAGFAAGAVFLTRGATSAFAGAGLAAGSSVLLTGAVGRCRFFFSILLVDAVDLAGSGS